MRRAFTVMEIILVLGVIAVAGSLSVPAYRYYAIVNDLERAADLVVHSLREARLRSELNEHDSSWGYHVASGTLYKGATYAGRDVAFDDLYVLPMTIIPSGLPEVSFAALTGEPTVTGSIILTAVNGAQRVITVHGDVELIGEDDDGDGGDDGGGDDYDKLAICHKSGGGWHTIKIPESAWPSHRDKHGDTLGPCSA